VYVFSALHYFILNLVYHCLWSWTNDDV
jgi:hypothetical protein